MRKKHLFWMLQIIMVLLLSAVVANAQTVIDPFSQEPVTPQVDENGQLIDENEDSINPADVCDDCVYKGAGFRISWETCSPGTGQTPIPSGNYYAFDRDAAFEFTPNATKLPHWNGAASNSSTSHFGYCDTYYPPDNYLFAICNCIQKTNFEIGQAYVFEVEILADGVYWSDRNLSLLEDAATNYDSGDFDDPHLEGALGIDSIGATDFLLKYELDNVVRYVVGPSKEFFCSNTWLSTINATGWTYPASATNYTWRVGYAAVQDYIQRTYKPDFDQSICDNRYQKPFDLNDQGEIGCPPYAPPNPWTGVNAKVLRTYPTVLFPSSYPILSQTPYLYLDLPTMVYDSNIAELCDKVYVMITLAQPFRGVCSTCCNLPMCSCKQYVGIFGCEDCEGDEPSDFYTKCVPYITNLLDDGWWDFLAISNMSENAITPVVTFYANGQTAEYTFPAIPAKSAVAEGLVGDISDEIAASYPSFPRTGAAIYAEVAVEGTSAFDAFYLTFNPDQGTTGYLARCAPCGTCSD